MGVDRQPVALLVMAVIMILVAGCGQPGAGSASPRSSGPAFLTREGIIAEYLAARESMSFPAGAELATPTGPFEGAISFEAGYGIGIAGVQLQCAWGRKWLRVRVDSPSAAEDALRRIEGTFDEPYMKVPLADESVVKHVRDIIDRARLGDASGIQDEIDVNCTAL